MATMDVRIVEPRRRGEQAGRPDLRLPRARPRVVTLRGARPLPAKGCVDAGRRGGGAGWLTRVKVAAVALLSVSAATMATVHLVAPEEPVAGYVAGDPAWAHVTLGP